MDPLTAIASNFGAAIQASPAGQQALATAQAEQRARRYLLLAVGALVVVLLVKR